MTPKVINEWKTTKKNLLFNLNEMNNFNDHHVFFLHYHMF